MTPKETPKNIKAPRTIRDLNISREAKNNISVFAYSSRQQKIFATKEVLNDERISRAIKILMEYVNDLPYLIFKEGIGNRKIRAIRQELEAASQDKIYHENKFRISKITPVIEALIDHSQLFEILHDIEPSMYKKESAVKFARTIISKWSDKNTNPVSKDPELADLDIFETIIAHVTGEPVFNEKGDRVILSSAQLEDLSDMLELEEMSPIEVGLRNHQRNTAIIDILEPKIRMFIVLLNFIYKNGKNLDTALELFSRSNENSSKNIEDMVEKLTKAQIIKPKFKYQ